jgi:hypothetical protein
LLNSLLLNFVLPTNWIRAAALGGGALLLTGSGSTALGAFGLGAKTEKAIGANNRTAKVASAHLIGSEPNTLNDLDN